CHETLSLVDRVGVCARYAGDGAVALWIDLDSVRWRVPVEQPQLAIRHRLLDPVHRHVCRAAERLRLAGLRRRDRGRRLQLRPTPAGDVDGQRATPGAGELRRTVDYERIPL